MEIRRADGTLLIIWLERAEKIKICPAFARLDASMCFMFSARPRKQIKVNNRA